MTNLDFSTFVSICSGIAVIWGVVKLINAPINEVRTLKENVKKLTDEQVTRKAMDRAVLNSLQAITNHMIDGNGIEKLKSSRDELSKTINDIATK